MNVHPDLQRQLVRDRHSRDRRLAEYSRLRRDARAMRRQRSRAG